ncbi:murein biosynthesis integral membrane protein MurJ [Acaryochloris thomasi]|uniref:murein biosynthesis integral membrane protein MurJ n=1 Tax=Acaryochloris thomasi TaxID=2929456 RepID=UPI000DA69A7D|nr:murein biosynthesis integral membrane protein MurJ [Acaryochloris thomasi]
MALPPKPQRSLASIATIVAIATLISKIAGLVREQAIASKFGAGAGVDAFAYAYIVPGFLFILLGGINGPFHSAIITVLAKRTKEEAAPLIETVNTLVGGLLLILVAGMMLFAAPIVGFFAPGAPPEVQMLAVEQFRIMAPLGVLSVLIGIGFGTLNASDQYWLPAISPLLSSLTVILGALLLADYLGPAALAWGTLAGGILQWLAQIVAQSKAGMGKPRLRFDFNRPGVREIFSLMIPATVSSGMLLISLLISTQFASLIGVGVPAALQYAQRLFVMPLGILSNVILVPYMPIFSKLSAPENWPELKGRIRQSLIITAMSMMPIGALMSALALPIIRVLLERGEFTASNSQLVASILAVYGLGMFIYLARDVLVRVFYGLGDGKTPFKITLVGLGFHALFCYLFTSAFQAQGLAMATVGVNLFSLIALLWILNRRLGGLPWRTTAGPIVGLAIGSFLTGVVAWGTSQGYEALVTADGLLSYVGELATAGTAGMIVFILVVWQLKLPEVNVFLDRLRQKIPGLKSKL